MGDYQTFSHNVHEFLASIHARLSLGHNELTKNLYFPLKRLNSTFNQELQFRMREHEIIEELRDLNLGRPFSFRESDSSNDVMSCGRSGPQSP